MVHTHQSLSAQWKNLRQSMGIEKFRRTLRILPTHFGHGLIYDWRLARLSGQNLLILPPFKPKLVTQRSSLLDSHEITCMSSVPPIWRFALKMARPPQKGLLQRMLCGSAPLSAHLWKGIQKWTGTQEVINAYGITETASWVAGSTMVDLTPEDGLIGIPWGAAIKIIKSHSPKVPPSMAQECAAGEAGHVLLNTPALMKGYLGRDDLTHQVVAQGWFYTGDVGLLDDCGIFFLRGRQREEINKGGAKVYPGDIDFLLEQHKQILDVCTFGYEDPLLGEDVGVAVVVKSASDGDFRELYGWLRKRLSKQQMPQRWYVLDRIPRSSRGKINRSMVAQVCSGLVSVDHLKIVRSGN